MKKGQLKEFLASRSLSNEIGSEEELLDVSKVKTKQKTKKKLGIKSIIFFSVVGLSAFVAGGPAALGGIIGAFVAYKGVGFLYNKYKTGFKENGLSLTKYAFNKEYRERVKTLKAEEKELTKQLKATTEQIEETKTKVENGIEKSMEQYGLSNDNLKKRLKESNLLLEKYREKQDNTYKNICNEYHEDTNNWTIDTEHFDEELSFEQEDTSMSMKN